MLITIGRNLLVSVYALPDSRLTRVASPGEFGLATGQAHDLVNGSFCVRHACVPQWIAHLMITQVIGKINKCYLMANNLCFIFAAMTKAPEMLKDRILERRTALGLSQAQLAEKAGVSQVTIQHLESGMKVGLRAGPGWAGPGQAEGPLCRPSSIRRYIPHPPMNRPAFPTKAGRRHFRL